MKTAEKIKKLFCKSNVTVSSKVNDKILSDTFRAFEKSMNTQSGYSRPNVWRVLVKSRIVRMAVTAAIFIVLALCWFSVIDNGELQRRQSDRLVAAVAGKTPAEMVSVISLNMVFRDGDMKAVERQFEQAEKKVKPTLRESVVIDQLISEL
jgi:hypothetical protein